MPFSRPDPPALEPHAPLARGIWCWPVLVSAVAVTLDSLVPLGGGSALAPLWLDVAAVAALVWALTGGRPGRRDDWRTPLDGRIVAGLIIAVLQLVHARGQGESAHWMHQIFSAGALYYSVSSRLRRESRVPDAIWPAFALLTLALSGITLLTLPYGAERLAEVSQRVDTHWASEHGLGKALVVGTVLCLGRALEPGARALWRTTAAVGAIACLAHGIVGGMGLGVASLAGLDDPFYFSTCVIASMLLSGLARMAWQLGRDRPEEAQRWRAAALTFPLTMALMLFGGTTGGEGTRLMLALSGAAVVATRFAPRAVRHAPMAPDAAEPAAPAARAA